MVNFFFYQFYFLYCLISVQQYHIILIKYINILFYNLVLKMYFMVALNVLPEY